MKNNKFIRYTTTVGALLTVSGGANAVIQPGSITGDALLDHVGDEVFIDLDRDGTPDFIGFAVGVSYGSIPDWMEFILYGYASGNFVEIYSLSTSFSWPMPKINNFNLNDLIGPLSYPYYYGVISHYSAPSPPSPPTAPFNPTNDEGYIGVSMLKPSGTCYGWIQVSIGTEGDAVEFTACALEHRTNDPIVAGNSVPVPLLPIASAAGLGLVGLMAALKKRKKK
ncbi:MAG: hypothetical protein K9H26_06220 [Prolixibacteraceae bacterium]|nr:hypothetical protein [Prolixibacteraceae bacterium]